MTTTTQISKSEVMKRAHNYFKTTNALLPEWMKKSFSWCLKKAWSDEKAVVEVTKRLMKEIAAKNERKRREEENRKNSINTGTYTYIKSSALSWGGVENFYGAGRYCGD